MFVHDASPENLLNWFHKNQTAAEVLCLLIPHGHLDKTAVGSIINNFQELDITMGPAIAFVVPYYGPDRLSESNIIGLSGARTNVFLAGRVILPGSGDTSILPFRNIPVTQRPGALEMIGKQVLRIVPEYMEFLGLDSESLPCLAICVRGDEKMTLIPLRNQWSLNRINSFLLGLARVVTNKPALRLPTYIAASATSRIGKLLSRAEQLESRMEVYRTEIGNKVDILERKRPIPEGARIEVARLIQLAKSESLAEVTKTWNIPKGQRQWLETKVKAVEKLRSEANEIHESQLPQLSSYRRWEESWNARREGIDQYLKEATALGIVVRTYERMLCVTEIVPWKKFADVAKLLMRVKTGGAF